MDLENVSHCAGLGSITLCPANVACTLAVFRAYGTEPSCKQPACATRPCSRSKPGACNGEPQQQSQHRLLTNLGLASVSKDWAKRVPIMRSHRMSGSFERARTILLLVEPGSLMAKRKGGFSPGACPKHNKGPHAVFWRSARGTRDRHLKG